MDLVRLSFDGIDVEVRIDPEEPPSLRSLRTAAVEAGFDGPIVPLVEVLTPATGHGLPMQRLSGTLVGARLRYRGRSPIDHGWALTLVDPETGLKVVVELTSLAPASLSARATVVNSTSERLVLTALTSLNLPVGPRLVGQVGTLQTLEVLSGQSEWTGESRWQTTPVSELLVDLRSPAGAVRKSACRWVSTGSWSTSGVLPVGVVVARDAPWAMAWQLEHNGAWRAELAEHQGRLQLSLSGPTDLDHGWLVALAPGERFVSVPVTVSFGTDATTAIGALTTYRRAARRAHPDNAVPALVYNDYMNTLMGDPTTERLRPLISGAAAAGAEVFCIDAGWYDDSNSWWDGVGAWQPSTTRFPGGLDEVLGMIRAAGMTPGLWLEPEVVGVRSPVADTLPTEAFFQRAGVRVREAGRYHLDLRHPAARAHLDEVVDRLVSAHGIGYLKLDYNIEPGAGTDHDADSVGAGLLGHNRAYLAWLDGVLDRHPGLVIENCASGAMRMDFALLSRLQLQSTSDQEDPSAYAPIAVAAPMSVLPEQAASWAYPSVDMNDEETAYVLSLGLLGRLYLSGFLDRLRPGQQGLAREAVETYKEIRASIPHRLPSWPTGLPGWTDPWLSLALVGVEDTLLTIFRRPGGDRQLSLDLPAFVGVSLDVEPLFPTGLPGWRTTWQAGTGTLGVFAPGEGLAARTFWLVPAGTGP